jgi:hypothetical protein
LLECASGDHKLGIEQLAGAGFVEFGSALAILRSGAQLVPMEPFIP